MLVRHHIKINERGVLLRNEKPVAFLEPGSHWAWGNTGVARFSVTDAIFDVPAELRSLVPAEVYREVELSTEERGVLFVDGVPKRVLRPGVHRFWTVRPGMELRRYDARQPLEELSEELRELLRGEVVSVALGERGVMVQSETPVAFLEPGLYWADANTKVLRFSLEELLLKVPPELQTLIPPEVHREVEVPAEERGVLFVDGVPKRLLRPGLHRYWTVVSGLELRRYDVRQPLEGATDALMRLLAGEVTFAVVGEQEHVLLYEGGVFQRKLPAGMHVFWNRADAPVSVVRFSTRAQHVLVPAQDLITRDKVSLRLSLSAEYRVVEPLRAVQAHGDLNDALYRRLQLAAREFVAAKRLDALLEGRNELNLHLKEILEKDAESFGLEIIAAGVKDIILPGEMKALLNRVIEAEKEAAAKVILRREEVAAMKSLASSAKVLEESPGALRLKEMEALREIAAQVGEMVVVLGEGGLGEMRKLIPSKAAKNT